MRAIDMEKLFYSIGVYKGFLKPYIIFFVLVSCPLMGQVTQKKRLTAQDYHLWSTMEMQTVSKKGEWVSYHLAYEDGNDTLFVRNKQATKTHVFAKGYDGKFAKDEWFACMLPNGVLSVTNLKTGRSRQVLGVKQYTYSKDGGTLVTLTEDNRLTVGSPDGKVELDESGVTAFVLNPKSSGMVYTKIANTSSLHEYSFDGKTTARKLAEDDRATFEDIVWQEEGQAFGFAKKYKDTRDVRYGRNLYLYRIKEKKIIGFDANSVPNIAKDSKIVSPNWTRFTISGDGKRVFFYISEKEDATTPEQPLVQVWNGNDPWTYSQVQLSGRWDRAPRCVVWWPDSNRFLQLTTEEQPQVMLSGNKKYAITYNPTGQKPQFYQLSKTGFYITELESGKQRLFLENQMCYMSEITVSPCGKYIMYFKDQHWWAYDIAKEKHFNVSLAISPLIYDKSYDYSGQKPAFGIVGWTKDNASILLYDEYDLWSVNLTNLKSKRLTSGREQQITFRLIYPLGQVDRQMNFDGFTFPKINLESTIYLKGYGAFTKQSGYYSWNGVEKPLVFSNKNITQLGFTKDSETYYYTVEDFNAPRSIIAIEKSTGVEQLVVKCNSQHENYHWGKSQLIEYINSRNQQLQAVLFYPSNYDPTKKYPMVVYIYEKLTQHLHHYVNPTLHNNTGINISNLTSQGYFVLYPDILFETGDVGMIATDCTVSATKEVISMGLVLDDKIALTGHSFGGYEADFIATQTDIFATVISGAGTSDLVSHYLSIGWNNGRAEAWRYEDHQYRIGKSLYDDMEGYLRNSPVMHAKNIKVPLLTWSGELDRQVHYYQSIEFYNALRRLGKKHIMLLYPENGHILTLNKSREDFTQRYEQWLATFLKDAQAPEWITKGMQ